MSSPSLRVRLAGPPLVDPRGPRFGAAVTTVVLAVALLTGPAWLLGVQAVVFALGAAGRSPYGLLYARLVRPRLGPPAALEDTRPLRFAQAVGLAFSVIALAGLAMSTGTVTLVAAAAALAAAFLNAAFGICLGCEVYLLARRATSHAIVRAVPNDRPAHSRTEVAA